MLGNFSLFCFLLLFFFQHYFFSKYSFLNNISVSNSLDQGKQARDIVRPDLGPNCLQQSSEDDLLLAGEELNV